ncbi:MAG: TonB family protein [Nannocystaceae bacterium]
MATPELTINVFRGDARVATHTLQQDIIKIGRLKSCHLRLEDEAIARMHAILEVSAQELRVIDLGSEGGAKLHGQRIQGNATLRSGDSLELGPYRLEIVAAAPAPVAVVHELPARVQAAQAAPIARGVGGITIDPSEVEVQDGTRVAEIVAVYGGTVLDVQHVGRQEAQRSRAPLWMAIGGALALGGAALFASEVSHDWESYRTATAEAAVTGAPAPAKPGNGLGGLGIALTLLGLIPLSVGVIRRGDAPRRGYTIGEAHDASFHMAASGLAGGSFPIVETEGDQLTLAFNDAMRGEVHYAGERMELAQLVRSGRATTRGGRHSFALPAGAVCRLEYEGVTFHVNSVAPGAKIAAKGETDKPFWLYNGGSFAILGSLLLLGQMIPSGYGELEIDEDDGAAKYVGYMTQADQKPEPEEVVTEDLEDAGEEAGGQGERARGNEGAAGNPSSREKNNHYAIAGNAKVPSLARNQSLEANARTAGILGLVQQESLHFMASADGTYAAGQDDMDLWGQRHGRQAREAYGVGRLGLVGTGRGGGGEGIGTIRLGHVGTIGHGSGGGSGTGIGRGAGFGDRTARKARQPRIGKTTITGNMDKDVIRRIVRAHINEVRHCYQLGLGRDPNLKGRVSVQFQIGGSGKVMLAVVQESTVKDSRVGTCVTQAVRRWKFPRPHNGGAVLVTYPFVFDT